MALNPHPGVTTFMLDEFKFLVVDDILADPGAFRADAIDLFARSTVYATDIGYELHPEPAQFERCFPNFLRELSELIHLQIGENVMTYFSNGLSFNRISVRKGPLYNCAYKLPNFPPHVDRGHISSFIYLTPPEQCSGGTGIYRHKPSGRMNVVQDTSNLDWMVKVPLVKPLYDSTEEWERLHMFEMRYNRLVAFNSSVIHKILFDPDQRPFERDVHKVRMAINNFFTYES